MFLDFVFDHNLGYCILRGEINDILRLRNKDWLDLYLNSKANSQWPDSD